MGYVAGGLSVLVCAWLLPNHYLPWAAAYQEFLSAAAVLVLTAGLGLSIRGPLALPRPALFLAGVAVIPLVQAAVGQIYFAGDGLVAAAYVLAFALAAWVGFGCTRHDTTAGAFAQALAWALVVGAVLSGAVQLVQWLRISGLGIWVMDMRPDRLPYGNLGQSNQQASLLCLGIAATWFLYERAGITRLTAGVLLAWLVPLVAMTQSRTPWLGAGVFAAVVLWSRFRMAGRTTPTVVGLVLACYAVAVVAWPTVNEALHLSGWTHADRTGAGTRPVIWSQMSAAILQSPWFGWGWNQVSVAQVAVGHHYTGSEMVEHSHNIVLDLLVWNGVPLGLAMIGVAGFWAVRRLRAVRDVPAAFATLVLLLLGVHACVELPHAYLYFLVPAGLAVGVLEARTGGAADIMVPRAVLLACGLLGLAIAGWFWRDYRIIEEETRLFRFEAAGIRIEQRPSELASVMLIGQQREFMRFARTLARPGMSAEELDWMRRVAHRYPYPPALFRYAVALARNNRLAEAEQELRRLRGVHEAMHFSQAIEGLRAMAHREPVMGDLANRLAAAREPAQ